MKLLKLVIQPVNENGWGSRILEFGEDVTQLYGPNGCGKTPVIHSIAYALGYPVRFREDIMENCEAVVLTTEHEERIYIFRRVFSASFETEVQIDSTKPPQTFYNEKDFSAFLFDLLGISTVVLTSTANKPVAPYFSALFPLFYVDQDSGYRAAYSYPNNFIKCDTIWNAQYIFHKKNILVSIPANSTSV